MEYIEREELLNNLKRFAPEHLTPLIVDLVQKQPTADVVGVRHGKWLYHECVSSNDGAISGYSCSHCGAFVDEEFETGNFHKKFCGNCGAKMDGKDGE